MMAERKLVLALVAYAVGFVVTFGHAYLRAECRPSQFVTHAECATASSGVAAAAWPLYWSVQAWRASAR